MPTTKSERSKASVPTKPEPKYKDPLVEFFRYICPALVGDGKRKTLIVKLGTLMAFPVALGGGLFWYYTQRGQSAKMKAYYKKLEQIYDDYDYYDDPDEPSWSSSSWVMLFASIGFVVTYAFRSLLFKTGRPEFGAHGIGEGLRQWAPEAGLPPQTPVRHPYVNSTQQGPASPPPSPVMHGRREAPVLGGMKLTQDEPHLMSPEFHQRRLGALNAASNAAPGASARKRFNNPSAYSRGLQPAYDY